MKKRVLSLLVLLMLLCPIANATAKSYGKPLTLEEPTAISAILANPAEFIGKHVRIEGMIIEVCAKRGCWVYISSDKAHEKIQVKVTDGEIVFPMSATGRQAIVEGIVEELQFSHDQLVKYKRHLAEEKGQPFDPSSVKKGEKMIRLIGLGAQIEE